VKKKICAGCKKLLDLSCFHGGGTGIKKSRCHDCVSSAYFIEKQTKLKKLYDDGDTKIDLCECGIYYLNEIRRGTGINIRTKCYACGNNEKNSFTLAKKTNTDLIEQIKTLKQHKRDLEKEVVSLRQLVSEYRKRSSARLDTSTKELPSEP
jgi:hypothetical protein